MLNIDEIRAVTAKATPGPWVLEGDCGYIRSRPTPDASITIPDELTICMVKRYKNAPFICGARQWVTALCDEVERLRKELANRPEPLEMAKIAAALKENAVLKRALELACGDAADGYCPDEMTDYVCPNRQTCPNANGNREDSGLDRECWYGYYIQRAREEMEK